MKKTFYKYTNKFLISMQLNTKKQIKNLQNLEKGAKATGNITESEKYSSIVSTLLQELKN